MTLCESTSEGDYPECDTRNQSVTFHLPGSLEEGDTLAHELSGQAVGGILRDLPAAYAAHLAAAGRSVQTAANRQRLLNRFARATGPTLPARSVTRRQVSDFIATRPPSAQSDEDYAIMAALRWTTGAPPPPRRRVTVRGARKIVGSLTRAEERAILAAPLSTKVRLIIRLGLHSGLRAGEMCQLPAAALPETFTVQLKGRIRHAFPTPETRALSAVYLTGPRAAEDKRGNSRTLLLTATGKPADNHDVIRWVKQAAQAARLERPITSHMLRHTFAANLLEAGGKLEDIAEILGHARTDTTRLYAKPRAEWTRQNLASLHPAHQTKGTP